MQQIIIIGGGASGIACALAAGKTNPDAKITILEQLDRVGKKILSTGNGRCNLSNQEISPDHYHSHNLTVLSDIMKPMTPEFVLDFFNEFGLLCCEEDSGRIYPYSFQASMVLDVLLLALKQQHINVICSCKVSNVSYMKNCFVVSTKAGQNYHADKVILSTGGKAAPHFGSDGSGYQIAKSFGHTCHNTYPCLVPFRCKYEGLNGLKGIHAHGVAKLYSNATLLGTSKGEILLTDYGISGIPAMNLSCFMDQVKPNTKCEIQIDLFPDWKPNVLRTFLDTRAKKYANETLEMFFTGLINKKIAYSVLKSIGITPLSRPIGSLKPEELDVLAKTLKSWQFPVTNTLSWDKAQTTGGGIPLDEIHPTTMESRLQPGLFLTGELLDTVGECGGFNLHWAWCTGIFAGRSAASSLSVGLNN